MADPKSEKKIITLNRDPKETPQNHKEPKTYSSFGRTEIHKHAFDGDFDLLNKALATNPEAIDTPDIFGCTPLYWAVMGGYPFIAKYLVSNGADPFAKNYIGSTPMSKAIGEDDEDDEDDKWVDLVAEWKTWHPVIGLTVSTKSDAIENKKKRPRDRTHHKEDAEESEKKRPRETEKSSSQNGQADTKNEK